MELSQIDSELQKEFFEKRNRAEIVAQKNRQTAMSNTKFAKLKSLEKNLIFEIGKADENSKETIELKKILKQTRLEKDKILSCLGLNASDLEPKYECQICGDTGFVGEKMCKCYKRARNKKIMHTLFENENYCEPDENATFENFNASIAKNKKEQENLAKLKTLLENFCKKFPKTNKKNIILLGKTGVGKTFSAMCIANKLKNKGFSVCVVTAMQLNILFFRYHTTFDSTKNLILSPLLDCDFLFVDDLGTEPMLKNVTENYLYLVLSERERLGKSIAVTTNLAPDNIFETYGERIYSRLFDKQKSIVLELSNQDLRLGK